MGSNSNILFEICVVTDRKPLTYYSVKGETINGQNLYRIIGNERYAFNSMTTLIAYYQAHHSDIGCRLMNPVARPPPAPPLIPANVKSWMEIPQSQIVRSDCIGEGCFGNVFKGQWKPTGTVTVDIAIKELKNQSVEDRKAFLKEAKLMKSFSHKNIVKFLGVVTAVQPNLLVAEFINGGSLYSYLEQRHFNKRWLNQQEMFSLCIQIADAMRYLHSLRVVHNDLATRNILIDETNGLCAKLSDFGLSKFMQKCDTLDAKSHGYDVWCFGWVVIEVVMSGSYIGVHRPLRLQNMWK